MTRQTIHDINFSQLYINHKQLAARPASQAKRWDEKAQKMEVGGLETPYSLAFVEAMSLRPSDTLLDIGCGAGTIAVLAAPHVKQVYGLDYSQGMLNKLQANMVHYNTHNIKTLCKKIENDWQDVPFCDVVIASRSTLVEDMASTLLKMNAHATRHVYLTYPANNTFGTNAGVDAHLTPHLATPSYLYILNILYQHGIKAQLNFIDSEWALIDWAVK